MMLWQMLLITAITTAAPSTSQHTHEASADSPSAARSHPEVRAGSGMQCLPVLFPLTLLPPSITPWILDKF